MGADTGFWDIFVYGTLRRGFHNHYYVKACRFLGRATTAEAYAMYVSGGIPSLVAGEARYRVTGEVYRVDVATLRNLDALEEHPRVYRRQEADIVTDDGAARRAWVYFARRGHGILAQTGDFAEAVPPSRI